MAIVVGAAPVTADFAPGGELRVMRADYFENYAGQFLSVEVFDDQVSANGGTGPTVSFAWKTATGTYGSDVVVPRFIDPQPSPDVYLYNRILVRVGPDAPAMIRVTSTSGAEVEAPVRAWLASAGPPSVAGYQRDFFTHYMDPTEVRANLDALAAQYPELVSVVNLPEKTPGYQRKATTVMGVPTFAPYAGQTGSLVGLDPERAVILESLAYGHEGGNDIFATLSNPGAVSSPLSVSVSGNELVVSLATDAVGALSSTAGQVVDAINATPAAAAMLRAFRYRSSTGSGTTQATPRSRLSDWLTAPGSVARGPFQAHLYRIGKQRDGSKVGTFFYCQQNGRDWVTPLTCLETAQRLVRNYATDPQTKQLLDNLEVFILPTVNPDGAHYSLYDNNGHRRNLVNGCAPGSLQDPMARHAVGVNIDRNEATGSTFDGYSGATAFNCSSEVFSGPFELSEPETRNQRWIVDTFPNIKFSLNVRSEGGYFMWPPGAYIVTGRATLPQPNVGLEAFHFAVAERVLSRVKESRGTAVLPERVGGAADVRSSEAGNSIDDQWYRKGIFAYTIAAGADRFQSTTDGTSRDPVSFMPDFATEGHDEAMEFASGAIGLLERALAYAFDTTAPTVNMMPNGGASSTPMTATFGPATEPSVIYYTLDGSTPTLASPQWAAERPRLPGMAFLFSETTTIKWMAVDVKGNVSAVRSAEFRIDTTPPVTTAVVSPADVSGWYVSPTVTLTADDGDGSGVDFIQYRLDGGPWTTYTSPVLVTGDGSRAFEYQAVDLGGNAETVRTLTLKVDATPPVTAAVAAPPAVNGWYVSPTVSLAAADGGGIGVETIVYRLDAGTWTTYAGAVPVTGDGAHALEYRASDQLGNDEAVQLLTLQVDGTQPGIVATTPPAGAVYLRGAVVPAAYTCSDALSGVTLCSGSVAAGAPIDTATAGTHTFVVNAQDAAGNTRQVTVDYEVVTGSKLAMRGGGHVPGPALLKIDFDFYVFEGRREFGNVRITVRDTGRPRGQDQRFASARTADEVTFSNAPAYDPGRNSKTPIDTVTFRGTGRWDGRPGYRYVVTASDRGEPGRGRDTFTIEVRAPDTTVVFSGGGTLTDGNVQSIGLPSTR